MDFRPFLQFASQVGVAKWAWRYFRWQFNKRVLKRDSVLTLPTGKRILLPRTSGSAAEVFVSNADLDWGSEILFASFAEAGADFLDVGAHIGYYALYMSPLVGRVFAFEPDPRNQAALTINASTGGNVTIVPKAVAETSGKRRLDVSQNSGISHLAEDDAVTAIDIDTVTIDSYVASVPEANVTLIKIDIEGHDLNAVKGGLDTIRAHQPLILAEFAPEGLSINDPEKLFRLCREMGYGVFAFARESDYAAAVLRNMSEEDLGCIWVKMLFLVPDRLNAAFQGLVLNRKTE